MPEYARQVPKCLAGTHMFPKELGAFIERETSDGNDELLGRVRDFHEGLETWYREDFLAPGCKNMAEYCSSKAAFLSVEHDPRGWACSLASILIQ